MSAGARLLFPPFVSTFWSTICICIDSHDYPRKRVRAILQPVPHKNISVVIRLLSAFRAYSACLSNTLHNDVR